MSKDLRRRVDARIAHIARHDAVIQAWQTPFFEQARERADALDGSAGEAPLALRGLLVGIKDIFDFAGYAPGNGLSFTLNPPAARAATAVARLEAAGAITLGTTRLTEYCYFRATTTTNPHDPVHTPGGSSSGSAAAVAAGMADVALGTQTVGSTIRPASFCGVYGFKPTYGAISLAGASALSCSMDHVGLFAREPADLAHVFDVLAGPDPRDPNTVSIPLAPGSAKQRLGLVASDGLEIAPAMRAAVAERFDELADDGWQVQSVRLPVDLETVRDTAHTLLCAEVYANLSHLVGTPNFNRFGPELHQLVEAGAALSLTEYMAARQRRREIAIAAHAVFEDCDLLVMPSALGAAPRGLDYTGDPICTVLTSLIGLPAANIPVGFEGNGLPLGMQAIAPRFADRMLLRALAQLGRGPVAPPAGLVED